MLKKTAAWIREHPYALCLLYFIPYLNEEIRRKSGKSAGK